MKDWTVEEAPVRKDIDWKNLAYDKTHRIIRKVTIGLFLLVGSLVIVSPVVFLEQYLPISANKDTKQIRYNSDELLAFIAVYFCPLFLYFINYILIPFLVIKTNFYENNHKYSSREFSIMNKQYIYMVFNSVMMPGLQYTITLRFV